MQAANIVGQSVKDKHIRRGGEKEKKKKRRQQQARVSECVCELSLRAQSGTYSLKIAMKLVMIVVLLRSARFSSGVY